MTTFLQNLTKRLEYYWNFLQPTALKIWRNLHSDKPQSQPAAEQPAAPERI